MKFEKRELKSGYNIAKNNFIFGSVNTSAKTIKFKLPNPDKLGKLFKTIKKELGFKIDKDKGLFKLSSIEELESILSNKKVLKYLNKNLTFDYLSTECDYEIYEYKGIPMNVRKTSSIHHEKYVVEEVFRNTYERQGCVFNKKDRWADIGCNIGAFSVLYSPRVKSMTGFDISESNVRLTNDNIALNKIKNAKANFKGVSHLKTGAKQEFFFGEAPGSSGMKPTRNKIGVVVEMININDLIEQNKIDCLKIDVEGAEYEMIKAIKPKNLDKIKQMIFEFHLDILGDVGKGEKYFEIVNLLKKHFKNVSYKEDIKSNWNLNIYCSN